jgi:BirA family biotin operon repressor/biotin-[acetyl-CoA-carboxylase] ligase
MRLREAVLGAIREEQGLWVSGERLSMSLKVSRTTIWKQIKILQSEGYAIESSPQKRLSFINDSRYSFPRGG